MPVLPVFPALEVFPPVFAFFSVIVTVHLVVPVTSFLSELVTSAAVIVIVAVPVAFAVAVIVLSGSPLLSHTLSVLNVTFELADILNLPVKPFPFTFIVKVSSN